jgi:hypothetical protein
MSPHESLLTWAQSTTDGYTVEFHPLDGTDRPMILLNSVALSTMEAEYIALSEAAHEAYWLRNLYEELGFPQ